MEGREPLDRIADALEKMAADPIIEYESGPPVCPHCGAFDPKITLPAHDEMVGPLSEFVIRAVAGCCGEVLFGVVESYSMHRTIDGAKSEIEARRERAGNG